jgi:transposase
MLKRLRPNTATFFQEEFMRAIGQASEPQLSNALISLGLDVHKKFVSVTVYRDNCRQSKAHVQTSELEAYIMGLQRKYGQYEIQAAYEAGFCGFSLQRQMEQLSVSTMVVNPADIPTTDKERTTKNDRTDSDKIARALSVGALRGIWIPDEELEGDRELVRFRFKLLANLKSAKSGIKMRLFKHGIEIPEELDTPTWSKKFRAWLDEQKFPSASSQLVFAEMLTELDHCKDRYTNHLKRLNTLAETPRYAQNMELLTSIPGIGRLTALSLLTEIGPIERFGTADQLASYVGLVPMQHQSGGSNRDMPIQRRAQSELRAMLIQCAWSAVRTKSHFAALYERKKLNKPIQKAIVFIARRQLNTVYAILKSQQPYRQSDQA